MPSANVATKTAARCETGTILPKGIVFSDATALTFSGQESSPRSTNRGRTFSSRARGWRIPIRIGRRARRYAGIDRTHRSGEERAPPGFINPSDRHGKSLPTGRCILK